MKLCRFYVVVFVCAVLCLLFEQGRAFEKDRLDRNAIVGLFDKSLNGLNNLRLDNSGAQVASEPTNEITRQVSVFMEEQCALECLRSVNCTRYSYSPAGSGVALAQCVIYLKKNLVRPASIEQTSIVLGCDSPPCANSISCSSSSAAANGNKTCPFQDVGISFAAKVSVTYELSAWSDWTPCSSACNDGFRSKRRKCIKKTHNQATNVTSTEEVTNQDWLCSSNLAEMYIVENCNMGACPVYTDWSEWSDCSRICNGFRVRERNCSVFNPRFCTSLYLRQKQTCSDIPDCDKSVLKFERTDSSYTYVANITNRGVLRMFNTFARSFVKLLTHTSNNSVLTRIGQVVCREFGFAKLVDTQAIPFSEQSQTTINSVGGLNCMGHETSIKECKSAPIGDNPYEVEVECQFNAYWSIWSPWSKCSVSCGIGAQVRTRRCDDPPPAKTSKGAGESCHGLNNTVANCIMPRCKI